MHGDGSAPVPVLHLITGIRPGGAERELLAFLATLDRTRYRPELAYLKGPPVLANDFIAAGVPVHRASGPGPFAAISVLRLLRRGRYRLLHTHLVQADVVGAIAAVLAGTRVVSSRHNDDAFLRNPFVAFGYRLASRPARRIVAISDWVRRFVIERRTVDDARKVVRVHYGLSPSPFDEPLDPTRDVRAELGIPASTVVIGAVARLVEQKGHRYLIEALPEVLAANHDVLLLVVGAGELDAGLRALAAQLGVTANVRFIGFRSDNVAVMRAIDVLALPSLWEGFGLVLLEAMAARKPVVASRVSAIPEIVEDGRTGYLVAARDPMAIAGALRMLVTSPETRREMGEAGRRRLDDEFSVERMTKRIARIYDEVLAGISRASPSRARD